MSIIIITNEETTEKGRKRMIITIRLDVINEERTNEFLYAVEIGDFQTMELYV